VVVRIARVWSKRNICRVYVLNLKETGGLANLDVDGKIILKRIWKIWAWLRTETSAGFCEHGNETPEVVKYREFLDHSRNCWLSRRDSTPEVSFYSTYIMDLLSCCSEPSWTKFRVGCWYGPPSCRSMAETDGACWHPVSHLSCSHRLLPVPPYKKTWVWCESKPVMTSWKGERETCGEDWYV